MKDKQNGFAHLSLIVLFLVVCLVICGIFLYVKNPHSNILADLPGGSTNQACKSKDGLNICLSSSKSHLSSSETTVLKTVISNTTNRDITETFNCDFTDPSIIADGNDLSSGTLCGQVITPRTIKAASSESFTYELSGSKLKTGPNTIKAAWHSYESGVVTVRKDAVTSDELSRQFKTCQNLKDNIDFDDVPSYCASINIILSGSNAGEYGCQDWKDLFTKISLSIPCTSTMDIGIGYVYVPRDVSEKYLEKVKSLPEVASAYIDTE